MTSSRAPLSVWALVLIPLMTRLSSSSSLPSSSAPGGETITMDIKMPHAHPQSDDAYLCHAIKVPAGENYIVNYEPLADGNVAHHMLLFGCDQPATSHETWTCGTTCHGKSRIMFAWAKNAPPPTIPEGVGFKVGAESQTNYFVLQIHYLHKEKEGSEGDESGLRIYYTPERQKYMAGIYILGSPGGRVIPGRRPKFSLDASCRYSENFEIHPFAFRTHAHTLSRVVTGYIFNGTYTMIGKGNPQWPQAFYPMDKVYTVKSGDYLLARCTYNSSDRERTTIIGETHNDEMCNFYIMYYTDFCQDCKDFMNCWGTDYQALSDALPPGSDTQLPHNALLEAAAHGHHHHPMGNTGGDDGAHDDDKHEEDDHNHHHMHEHDEETVAREDEKDSEVKEVTVVPAWPRFPPEVTLGQVGGVCADSKGKLHIFHRGAHVWDASSFDGMNVFTAPEHPIQVNAVLTVEVGGIVVNQWGKDRFYLPHGLHIDQKDNIWLTDVALHQVFKYNAGEYDAPALTLGERFVPGSDTEHFCKPTSVAVLPTGEFFVADGYCNGRILKFSPDGKVIHSWGEISSSKLADGFPPPSTFSIPHSLTLLEDKDQLCVADRENRRIQCFDYNGKFLRQIHSKDMGNVYGVAYSKVTGILYAVDGRGHYNNHPNFHGFSIDPMSGTIISKWAPDSGFSQPHDLAVNPAGDAVFVGEIGPNKVWKFTLPNTGLHHSVKKGSIHPGSHGNKGDDRMEDAITKSEEAGDLGASMVIGALLIIPVIIVVLITVFLRLRKSAGNVGYARIALDADPEEAEKFLHE